MATLLFPIIIIQVKNIAQRQHKTVTHKQMYQHKNSIAHQSFPLIKMSWNVTSRHPSRNGGMHYSRHVLEIRQAIINRLRLVIIVCFGSARDRA